MSPIPWSGPSVCRRCPVLERRQETRKGPDLLCVEQLSFSLGKKPTPEIPAYSQRLVAPSSGQSPLRHLPLCHLLKDPWPQHHYHRDQASGTWVWGLHPWTISRWEQGVLTGLVEDKTAFSTSELFDVSYSEKNPWFFLAEMTVIIFVTWKIFQYLQSIL